MNFAFTPEQDMLRDSVRSFLADKVPSSRVRELMETDRGFDDGLWSEMAALGWPAMHIPEEYGGAGFGHLELGIVLEETGAALTPSPLFATVVLGANLVLLAGGEDQKKELLPDVAAGQRRLAVAIVDEGGDWDPATIVTSATPSGDAWILEGAKRYVIDGHTADTLLVAARTPDGIRFFAVPGDAPGVERELLETMDMTRKQAAVRLDRVEVPGTALLAASDDRTLDRLYDLVAVGLAFEQVGGAQKCLDAAVEYAKVRTQFGRPIGSFQAIKHKCADMLVKVESAKSAAYYAGWAASAGSEELPVAAALAKAYCSDAYFDVAADNIQVHGGIGFTWEHDAHLYFKRAKTSQLLLGDGGHWRSVLADRVGL